MRRRVSLHTKYRERTQIPEAGVKDETVMKRCLNQKSGRRKEKLFNTFWAGYDSLWVRITAWRRTVRAGLSVERGDMLWLSHEFKLSPRRPFWDMAAESE